MTGKTIDEIMEDNRHWSDCVINVVFGVAI